MNTVARVVALCGCFALVGFVSGCGGPSHATDAAPSTTTTTAGHSPTVHEDIQADQAAAKSASLVLADFPTGWTSSPDTSSNDAAFDKEFSKCLGPGSDSVPEPPASYDSPNFSDSDNHTASSTVNYRPTAADQAAAFALFSNPKTAGCLSTVVKALVAQEMNHPSDPKDSLPGGAAFGESSVSPMSFPAIPDRSAAYQVKFSITYKGLDISVYLDMIYVIKGRAVAFLTFEGVVTPFPSSQEEHYTGLVVGRLTNTGRA